MFKHKLILSTALIASLFSISAFAAAPQQKTQAPGYFRMALGDFEVTALSDGYLAVDPQLFKGISAKEIAHYKERSQITQKTLLTPVNAYLVNTGSQLILVDAGSSSCFGPTVGRLMENLKAAGYQAEQVDLIVITHMHADHLCGASSPDGKILFPNAELRMAKADADFWLSEEAANKAPDAAKALFKMAREAVKPYQAAGKFKPFAPGEKLAEGMQVVDTHGHTPGHSSYQFTSKGQSMMVIGDLIHSHALQFPRPNTAIVFDIDSKIAVPRRLKVFDGAVKTKTWVAASHIPFPGIGQLRKEGKGYAWLPVDFAPYGVSR